MYKLARKSFQSNDAVRIGWDTTIVQSHFGIKLFMHDHSVDNYIFPTDKTITR